MLSWISTASGAALAPRHCEADITAAKSQPRAAPLAAAKIGAKSCEDAPSGHGTLSQLTSFTLRVKEVSFDSQLHIIQQSCQSNKAVKPCGESLCNAAIVS